MLTRRTFISLAALAGARAAAARKNVGWGAATGKNVAATVRGTTHVLATMPVDFTGLSYEIVQLYNPGFFSAKNVELVKAFRELSAHGVLRLGGNLSDVSRWKGEHGDFATAKQTAAVEHGKTYWEWKLTDQTVREGRDGAITPAAIRELGTFLQATQWRLIYGLNFGCGSAERAADEAACVSSEIGDRLIAFQVGNEADFFGGNRFFREPPFGFAEYAAGYREFVAAVRERVPGAVFAGPDTATNMGWVDEFGKAQRGEAGGHRAKLLSSHYYAMGPAKDPAMNAERLLGGNDKLNGQIEAAQRASADAGGLGFRMTEGNSCFGGGKPGVSDALASALWVVDYMLYVSGRGYVGVNLHGGGDGYYTPIETLEATKPSMRPEYMGMQMAERFAGYAMHACAVETEANVTAYMGSLDRGSEGTSMQLAVVNKGAAKVAVRVEGVADGAPQESWLLSGPGVEATTGVSFARVRSERDFEVPAYSAQMWCWKTGHRGKGGSR